MHVTIVRGVNGRATAQGEVVGRLFGLCSTHIGVTDWQPIRPTSHRPAHLRVFGTSRFSSARLAGSATSSFSRRSLRREALQLPRGAMGAFTSRPQATKAASPPSTTLTPMPGYSPRVAWKPAASTITMTRPTAAKPVSFG